MKKGLSLILIIAIVLLAFPVNILAMVQPKEIELHSPVAIYEGNNFGEFLGVTTGNALVYYDESDGWYYANTWMGTKWVRLDSTLVTIDIQTYTYLYSDKNASNPIKMISPQTVYVASSEDNWVQIQVDEEFYWIKTNFHAEKTDFENLKVDGIDILDTAIKGSENFGVDDRFYLLFANAESEFVNLEYVYDKDNKIYELYQYNDITEDYDILVNSGDEIKLNLISDIDGKYSVNLKLIEIKKGNRYGTTQYYRINTNYDGNESDPEPQYIELLKQTDLYVNQESQPDMFLAPQTVLVIEEGVEGWYLISTGVGDRWVNINFDSIFGDPVEEPEPQYLELIKQTDMYESKDAEPEGYLAPQTVLVVEEGVEGWYLISTGVGDRWVNINFDSIFGDPVEEPEPQYLELIKQTDMYESKDAEPEGYLAPQTVLVVEEGVEGWYLISTSVGDRWVNINFDSIFGDPVEEPESQYLELIKQTDIYEFKDAEPEGYLAPQTVLVVEEGVEGWYLISTSVGDRWVNINFDSIFGDPVEEPESQYLELIKQTDIYEFKDAEPEGYLAPQTVLVVEEGVEGWYLISTSVGDRWININFDSTFDVSVDEPQYLELIKQTDIYISKDTEPDGYLAPQTVLVVEEGVEGWYLISTSIGDRWVNINFDSQIVNTYIEIFERKDIYMNIDDVNPIGYLEPQVLRVLNQNGDWYLVVTSVGDRWINLTYTTTYFIADLEVIYQYETTQRYDLYLTMYSEEPDGFIEGQILNVVEEVDNWRKVETSIGYRWINLTYTSIYDEWSFIDSGVDETRIGTLEITETEDIFLQKDDIDPVGCLNPQIVQVKQIVGDWYEIYTWEGYRWLNPILDSVYNNEVTDSGNISYIQLYSSKDAYTQVNDLQSVGILEAGTYEVLENQEDGWTKVVSEIGNVWIFLE